MQSMPNDTRMPDLIEAMDRQIRLCARLYLHLTKATIGRFGDEGEKTVRQGLRELGVWRAREMQAAHHALGKPIDMQSLTQYWDNASTFLVKDDMEAEGHFTPYDVRFDVAYCPAAEAWKEDDFRRWGHVYCDEFHQACASSYHPDGNVVIPLNLMKGDEHCQFRWIMPPDASVLDTGEPTAFGKRLARDYAPASELEGAWMTLRRSNRLFGGWYIALAGVVMERHGHEPIVEALRNWGADRGRRLRALHSEKGIPHDAKNFTRHHDLPVAQVWSVRTPDRPNNPFTAIIENSPQDDAFSDYHLEELGVLFYEESYPTMLESYLPHATLRWTALKCRGDSVNQFEIDTGSGTTGI
jgi:hypothetical protein